MNGDEVRKIFNDMKSTNKIKVIINGITIPYMSDYSFVDAKSFFKEPTRSANGVIENLNAYATFLTPRLKIKFKFMPVETYRTIMKLIKNYNEFIVTVYDIVEDKYVTHKMYFYPKEFPALFQNNLETLAVLDESFELVGTNASLEELSVRYNSNPPIEGETPITTGKIIMYNDEFVVGDYDKIDGSVDPNSFAYQGFTLEKWNTKADGSGVSYFNGDVINNMSTSFVLYAIWKADTKFILSFDYRGATSGISEQTREFTSNDIVATLPKPTKNGYVFDGWLISLNKLETLKEGQIYPFNSNATIYAKWIGVENNIEFFGNTGDGTMESIKARAGESVVLPKSRFVKNNMVFANWNTLPNGKGETYKDQQLIVMDTIPLYLYAMYEPGSFLTYNTNGGVNDNFKAFGKVFDQPIYTEKKGYRLAGWYLDQEFTQGVVFPLTLTSNITIYARWEEFVE